MIFKKQLNLFVSKIIKLKYKEFEIEAEKVTVTPTLVENQESRMAVSATIEESITSQTPALAETIIEKITFTSLVDSWISKDKLKMQQVYEELQKNEANENEKIRYEAIYYSMLYQMGEAITEKFSFIEVKSKDTSIYSNVLLIIARAYENTEEYGKAKEYFQKVTAHSTNNEWTRNGVIGISDCLFMLGNKSEALNYLIKEVDKCINNENKFDYLKQLAELSKKNNNQLLQRLALEKALEIKPNDTGILFSLGYTYAEEDNDLLSLLHYKTLLKLDPNHQSALNNLGVTYKRLGFNIKSIEKYKESSQSGNTLATSNLAYQFLNNGFLDEAKHILEEALKKENIHSNVYSALRELKEKQEEEKEKEIEKLEEARFLRGFYRSSADARFDSNREIHFQAGNWKFSDGAIVVIEVNEGTINISWDTIYSSYKYSGNIINRFLELSYFASGINVVKTERKLEEKGKAFAYINNELNQISINNLKDKRIIQLIRF